MIAVRNSVQVEEFADVAVLPAELSGFELADLGMIEVDDFARVSLCYSLRFSKSAEFSAEDCWQSPWLAGLLERYRRCDPASWVVHGGESGTLPVPSGIVFMRANAIANAMSFT
ncbi:hypothetical protein LPY97_13265 [Nocardia huaxiensis]|nr:hypothetical protein [Nocardia huaxiensis]UFS98785.1 hypothetical protein LPY97_13265 [Nocardia huaxiensis]